MTEKTYLEMQNEFLTKFRKQCLPILNEKEIKRKEVYKKTLLLKLVFIILMLTFLIMLYLFISKNNTIYFILASVTFVLSMIILFYRIIISKALELEIKLEIMPIVCDVIGNIEWFHNVHDINHNKYTDAGILTTYYDRAAVDDVFKGQHNGIKYEIAEAWCRNMGSKDTKNQNQDPLGLCVYITLDMNKKFNSHTVIKPNKSKYTYKNLRLTTMEDIEFEKKFDIYTNDEIDARYLITPSFMERLNGVKTAFNVEEYHCAFYQDKFYIALLCNKDLFGSININETLKEETYFQMFEEILSIIKLIDHFKLDQKIGL